MSNIDVTFKDLITKSIFYNKKNITLTGIFTNEFENVSIKSNINDEIDIRIEINDKTIENYSSLENIRNVRINRQFFKGNLDSDFNNFGHMGLFKFKIIAKEITELEI